MGDVVYAVSYEHSTCALCEAKSYEGKFMFCSKCRVVVYCSKDHQVAHWKKHRRFCKDHVWRKENPMGVAASIACDVSVCACKKWYSENSRIPSRHTQGYQQSMGQSSPFGMFQNQFGNGSNNRSASNPELGGPSQNGGSTLTLNDFFDDAMSASGCVRGENRRIPHVHLPNTASPSSDQSPSSCESIHPSFNEAFGFPQLNDSGKNPPESYEISTSSQLTQQSPSLFHTLEDLENYAPSPPQHPSLEKSNAPSRDSPITAFIAQLLDTNQDVSEGLGPGELPDSGNNTSGSNNSFQSLNSGSSDLSADLISSTPIVKSQDDLFANLGDDNSQGDTSWPQMTNSNATIPFQHLNTMQFVAGQSALQTKLWIKQVWHQVIDDMNRYGVCVVDNLLGEARGGAVFREVQSLYQTGVFCDGQLVKGDERKSKNIRGDKIAWVDGSESHCKNISVLIKLLDNIVMGANNRKNNGKLGTYRIKERSKAMVACYPGSGTHYVKHVDNPNDDGRCVTAIYYLNKDWNTQENGGLLRIFPEGWSHQVADIEPLFDRVIFFWSDRRNPHEVQPAFRTRYAITLWYYDAIARERAKQVAAAIPQTLSNHQVPQTPRPPTNRELLT